jgi:hypothetical protein
VYSLDLSKNVSQVFIVTFIRIIKICTLAGVDLRRIAKAVRNAVRVRISQVSACAVRVGVNCREGVGAV